jgi:tetratricopeptide (TPR) repeat protein
MQDLLEIPMWLLIVVFFSYSLCASAQSASADNPVLDETRTLISEQRWQDVVSLLAPLQSRSAEMDFYYGLALARMERWGEAESAFEAGRKLTPRDPRFSVELAGVAFKTKRYSRAAYLMRQAIKLNPDDTYANDFLGTIYFLEGNLPATLKYWNRVNKPQIAGIEEVSQLKVAPVLLDRAFAFSSAETLKLRDFLETDSRIRGLDIFLQYQWDLNARDDGKFDVGFRSQERNGFGDSKLEGLILFFRGLPFSGVNPEYYNFRHEAINFVSMYRWDAQKRRILGQFSSPFEHSAKYRYRIGADLRDENWVIRDSFTGLAPALAGLNLRGEELRFDIASFSSDRLRWSCGAAISHRDFRNVETGTLLTPELLAKGYQLKQRAEVDGTIGRVPERRFAVDAGISSEAARLWSHHEESFDKLQGSVGWHWFPKAEGDDYEMQQEIRSGGTFGQAPFDELFMLGLERDNDLSMRAHIGTRDGRKGSAPLGRDYFLSNWETDKNVWGNGIVVVKLGPFFDTGEITDRNSGQTSAFGSHKWLFDIGAQAKLRVFGSGVVFSYGKDLRSGNNAFYVNMLKRERGNQ